MVDVSILIPVYNVREYIIKCLESVAAQTYNGPLECIIVDDCGNDGSISLAEGFVAKYKGNVKFRILRHEHNRGLAAARNTAVAAAQGVFIFHLDSDDWLEPTAIELLLNKQRESGADIVSGNALRCTIEGEEALIEPTYKTNIDMVYKTIEMTLDHVIWRRLIRRTLYTDNNITAVEGVNIGEDHHTLPRLAYYANSIAKVEDVVYHYNCLNPNSYMSKRTKQFNFNRYRSDLASIKILKDFFENKDQYCVDRLDAIKREYQSISLRSAAKLMDHKSYLQICNESGLINLYYMDVFMSIIKSVKDEIKNLIQICFSCHIIL